MSLCPLSNAGAAQLNPLGFRSFFSLFSRAQNKTSSVELRSRLTVNEDAMTRKRDSKEEKLHSAQSTMAKQKKRKKKREAQGVCFKRRLVRKKRPCLSVWAWACVCLESAFKNSLHPSERFSFSSLPCYRWSIAPLKSGKIRKICRSAHSCSMETRGAQ